jgi:hypothetical protein
MDPKKFARIGVREVTWVYPFILGALEYFRQIGIATGILWVKQGSIYPAIYLFKMVKGPQ